MLDDEVADEARFLLRSLEDGYQLAFTRSALIFDFEKNGTDVEREQGIEYHRIGADLVKELVEAAAPTAADRSATAEELAVASMPERTAAELERRRGRTPSIPTLDDAAFLGSRRERTVAWEELRAGGATVDERELAVVPERVPSPEKPRAVVEAPPIEEADGLADSSVEVPVASAEGAGPSEVSAAPVPAPVPQEVEATPPPEPETEPVGTSDASPDLEEPPSTAPDLPSGLAYDVMLGVMGDSPQFGVVGEVSGRTVALDLNQTHTISLFGVQGGGKSYTLGSVVEMASLPIEGINQLPQPLASVIFHYSPTMDYAPEFTTMVSANSDEAQVAALRERYGAEPKALSDVVMLVPEDKLDERRAEYPGIGCDSLTDHAAHLTS